MTVRDLAAQARQAALALAAVSEETRVQVLLAMADVMRRKSGMVCAANSLDMSRAQADGLAAPLLKRLAMGEDKIQDACVGLRALASLADPLGRTQMGTELAEGLSLFRVSCPIGVIGVVFESRPDALVQIASLCLRSGNAVLLMGGREARETNTALYTIMNEAALAAGIAPGWAALLETREDVEEMLALDDLIDLVIPRGSNAFVRHIKDHSRIPVLGHADGLCHVYIDQTADLDKAVSIAVDSKVQNVSVCNAMETLLIHESMAEQALPLIADALEKAGVTLRGCPRTRSIISCSAAEAEDWDREYLDYILSIRVVDSLEEAIGHINRHGSGHTDAIVTQAEAAARAFCAQVDSAGVFWNCSTRFADGYRYGFGAEVGISTGKIHARGPMGIEGLCTYKYILIGNGQTVGSGVSYTHKALSGICPL